MPIRLPADQYEVGCRQSWRTFSCTLSSAVAVWAGASAWSPARCQEAARRGAPFDLTATRDADGVLRLQWVIAADTYLYRDRISAAATGGQRLSIVSEPGEIKDDPNFGPVEIYRDRAEASVPGAALAGLREVRIAYQGCAEKGICYPPVTRSFRLASAGRAVRRGPRYGGCSHPVPVCHRRRPSGESE